MNKFAPLAQLDRALVYGTKGQEFESLTARHKKAEGILPLAFLFAPKRFYQNLLVIS